MPRKPNCSCVTCGKSIYRRPHEINTAKKPYQCKDCRSKPDVKICLGCNKEFSPKTKKQLYCSLSCSASKKRGTRRKLFPEKNNSYRRLKILKSIFDFENCMIEGCNYSKIFEIHRHIPKKDGGKYEVGNMFAICPNHHAEITRKIIKVEKVSDCLLREIK